MIPTIPNYNGYVVGPNGEQLRTPLQQIEKNKQDVVAARADSLVAVSKAKSLEKRVAALESGTGNVEKPDIPTGDSTKYYLIAINEDGETIAKPYSNQAVNNSVAMRTGAGGLLITPQYGEKEMAATLSSLENAQTFNFVDYFSSSNPSYLYKPYQFAAKGWGSTQSYAEGRITGVPTAANTEYYQKIANASGTQKTVVIENGLQFNQSYSTVEKCVSQFTDKIVGMNYTEGNIKGRNNLWITIKPHSTINIRCRNRPTGYTQIWIT